MIATYISSPKCLLHNTPKDHPECPERLQAIQDRLVASGLDALLYWRDATEAHEEDLLRVHTRTYLDSIQTALPTDGDILYEGEVNLSKNSLLAARFAAGAVINGVDQVLNQCTDVVFCGVRPPGHHANQTTAMGFCLINNIAVGAKYALDKMGLTRVAIVDFDVHHGNGTQDIFYDDPRVLFCSSFQHPFYPFTNVDDVPPHIINSKLDATSTREDFHRVITEQWLPALQSFKPQLLFISAGFDAYIDDDMSSLRLVEQDYFWVSKQLRSVMDNSQAGAEGEQCKGIISSLEGGYDLESLGRCVVAHIKGMAKL